VTLGLLANIDVDDLARAVTFYVDALDLHVGRRIGAGVVELLGASSPIYLLQKSSGSTATPASGQTRDYGRHWTPVHLDFVVDDLAASLARAVRAGATLEGEVREAAWGRIAMLADPFGHGLCLIEFLNRGYDEIAVA
jgi:predicted enzyme related to lactoylglutathione lyase